MVDGAANDTRFELEVTGRGFGLNSVEFDVSSRQGVATPDLAVAILTASDEVIERIEGERIALESPRKLYAEVRRTQPIPTGSYDVALFEGERQVARKAEALFVPPTNVTPKDAAIERDAGEPSMDADVPDDGGTPDGGIPDMGMPDTGIPDTGPPDSGLGPFQGAYQYRQLIEPNNTVAAPAGVTIEVPIPHAQLVADGAALSDGADLAIYQGPDRLEHQWRDRFAVGTDQLVIVARILRDIPVGGAPDDPLVLYYGDAAATLTVTDGVFEFSERFLAEVGANWFVANNWIHCNLDRPTEAILAMDQRFSYCVLDVTNNNLVRQTLATPNLALSNNPGANLTYEMSVWMAGQTVDGPDDILYFSYGAQNDVFDTTLEPDAAGWGGFTPNGTLTFTDTDDQPRTVSGWRYPVDQIQWWQRTTLRFVPAIDQPALHFRHVSTNANTSNASFAAIDDWWVRKALDPDFQPVLGPVETPN